MCATIWKGGLKLNLNVSCSLQTLYTKCVGAQVNCSGSKIYPLINLPSHNHDIFSPLVHNAYIHPYSLGNHGVGGCMHHSSLSYSSVRCASCPRPPSIFQSVAMTDGLLNGKRISRTSSRRTRTAVQTSNAIGKTKEASPKARLVAFWRIIPSS